MGRCTADESRGAHGAAAILGIGVLATLIADRLASRFRIPAVVLEIGCGILVGLHVLDGRAAAGREVEPRVGVAGLNGW